MNLSGFGHVGSLVLVFGEATESPVGPGHSLGRIARLQVPCYHFRFVWLA